MSRPVLVTGATGNVGRAVVAALQAASIPVRAAARTRAEVGAAFPDVEAVTLDVSDVRTFGDALAGVGGVFLIRPPAIARGRPTVNALIDAAARAGVDHVVFSSVAGADANPLLPHHRIERHLQTSALSWTILRPGFFAQNLGAAYRTDIRRDDRIYVPAGDAHVAFLDVRDIGDVVAEIMRDPAPHRGRSYPLTGPELRTFDQVAAALTRELGRPIRYEPATASGYVRHLRSLGLPATQIAVQLLLHLVLRRDAAATADTTPARLLGRPGRTIETYIADHRDLWRRDNQDTLTDDARPPIERVHPPHMLMRVVNPLMRTLLTSRVHGLMSSQLLVLHFTGRRTGRRYDVPVGYDQTDAGLRVLTNSGWRTNFRGGRDITVTYRGQRRPAHATTIEDPTTVAQVYEEAFSALGVKRAQRRMGIRVNLTRPPTREELIAAVRRLGLSIVSLSLDEHQPAG